MIDNGSNEARGCRRLSGILKFPVMCHEEEASIAPAIAQSDSKGRVIILS